MISPPPQMLHLKLFLLCTKLKYEWTGNWFGVNHSYCQRGSKGHEDDAAKMTLSANSLLFVHTVIKYWHTHSVWFKWGTHAGCQSKQKNTWVAIACSWHTTPCYQVLAHTFCISIWGTHTGYQSRQRRPWLPTDCSWHPLWVPISST